MKRDFDMQGVGVHIGMPAYTDIPPQTALCLVETGLALWQHGIPFNMVLKRGCCYVDQVRCYIANEFLGTKATHLFMIDADMVWRPEQFLQILAHATKMPVVAATYRLKTEEERYAVNLGPIAAVNEYGCIPATGVGLGFCCVQRVVMEALAAKAPRVMMNDHPEPMPMIFRCDVADGWYRGEDIAFFADVAGAGFTPWLDLGVDLGHLGRKEYRGSFLKMLEAYRGQTPGVQEGGGADRQEVRQRQEGRSHPGSRHAEGECCCEGQESAPQAR